MSDLENPTDAGEETWTEFLAPDVVVEDTDLDGVADTVLVDADADAVADAVIVDTDADAVADTMVLDTDADAVADTMVLDTDADGVADTVIVDDAAADAAGETSEAAGEVVDEAANQSGGESVPEGPPEVAAFDQDADNVADAPGEFDPFPDTTGVTDAQWAEALDDAEGDRTMGPLDEDDVPTNEDLDQALTDLDTTADIGNYL